MQRRTNDASKVNQLQSVDDYFPLFLEQALQLYAMRMKDNEVEADTVVSIRRNPDRSSISLFRLIVSLSVTFLSIQFKSFKMPILHCWVETTRNVWQYPISIHTDQVC